MNNARRVKKRLAFIILVFIIIVAAAVSFATAKRWVTLTAVREMPVTLQGIIVVECTLTNYSIRPVNHGFDFSIEKQVGGEWVAVDIPEGINYQLGIAILWPFSSETMVYPLGWSTDTIEAGTYRIAQTVWTGDLKDAKVRTLYCGFTVH